MGIVHLHTSFTVYFIFISFITEFYAQSKVYEENYDDLEFEYDSLYLSTTTECQDETSFSVQMETKAKAITFKTLHKKIKCEENQILFYLAKLQVINPEGILLIASYKDIDYLCRKIVETLHSIDNIMQSCIPLPEDHLYMQLIAGVRIFSSKLCVYTNYQSLFRRYMKCYQQLHDEYLDCAGPTDWSENMEIYNLCNQFKAISDCYYTLTSMLCGIEAAKVLKELVIQVITAVIWANCPNVYKDPIVLDPMPELNHFDSSSSANTSINLMLIMLLINAL